MVYKSLQTVIKLLNDYSSIISEAKNKVVKYGEGKEIGNPNRMFEKLPIPLAQVKAGNTSKNLLNEIRQII